MADGTLRVTEVSAEGSVPELRVRNFGEVPVLILDGEELIGAKQNRTVNVTILVPPWSEILIPVSCIEAGRWSRTEADFEAAGRVANPALRSARTSSVTSNLRRCFLHTSDQAEVWNCVDDMLAAVKVSSATRSLSAGYVAHSGKISAYLAAFVPQPRQVGVVYRIGGILAGLDLLGSESLLGRSYAKLVRGAALQAIANLTSKPRHRLDDGSFLRAALTARAERFDALGMGSELRIDTGDAKGSALTLKDGLVHLSAFPVV